MREAAQAEIEALHAHEMHRLLHQPVHHFDTQKGVFVVGIAHAVMPCAGLPVLEGAELVLPVAGMLFGVLVAVAGFTGNGLLLRAVLAGVLPDLARIAAAFYILLLASEECGGANGRG